jgi:hypothetical protein
VRRWVVAVVVTACLVAAAPSPSAALDANYTCAPTAGCTDWATTDVVLRWFPSPDVVDTSNCPIVKTISSEGVTDWQCGVTDSVTWVYSTATIRIDKSAPTATGASTSRHADANGWFNHPVAVDFAGADAVSGIASCTSLTYAGPDSAAAAMAGTCTDRAGNRSDATPFTLKYDSTAPDVTRASPARKPDHDGWFNHPVRLRVSGTDGLRRLAGVRVPLRRDAAGAARERRARRRPRLPPLACARGQADPGRPDAG